MYANYHTHTFRCGHAHGTEREYIERAIAGGIKILGFSDHVAFRFPDGHESGFRMKTDTVKDYFSTLSALREEYKDKIKIYIGFEMEYYPLYFEQMYKNVSDWGAEYLILGQHFTGSEFPGGHYSGSLTEDETILENYTNDVIAGMKTGVYKYLAHPDVVNFRGDRALRENAFRRICAASAETGIPLEINFLGIRDDRHYPAADFWKIAGEEKAPVIFGMDAHESVDAWDPDSLAIAEKMIEEYGLTLVEELKI